MLYFLDTEFNGFGGELISLALVSEAGKELYLATHCPAPAEWVKENVMPILRCEGAEPHCTDVGQFGRIIARFLAGDRNAAIVADWPDDISYFCKALITAPGEMVAIPQIQFQMLRVDAYPTDLPGAVQHNALWDARALRATLTNA